MQELRRYRRPLGAMLLVLVVLCATAQAGSTEVVPSGGPLLQALLHFLKSMGISHLGWRHLVVIALGLFLIYLGGAKKYEPLLLIPIGFGAVLTNVPLGGLNQEGGILYFIYTWGIKTGIFPLLVFMGVGALTDFGPLLANPVTALLGAAAQFGIFATLFGSVFLGFSLSEAGSIGIIGGADGPTAIFTASRLAPHLLGAVAIAAYSYMGLIPIIQPPLMKLLVPRKERVIQMEELRPVGRLERVFFSLTVFLLCLFLVPSATPLIGMLMLGNLLREIGVVDRLARSAQNEIINVSTVFLGLGVGSTLTAERFLAWKTLGILGMGLLAFALATSAGLLLGRLMCWVSKGRINPLIGAAGVSAVPMAARVVQTEAKKANPDSYLLMHAMGPNVAGVIGSAVAAGVILSFYG